MRFDLLSQYDVPYLHPLVVHFPVVLLLVAAGAAVVYALLGRGVWRVAALVLFALGAAGAVVAGETGETLAQDVGGEPVVEAVLGTHARVAEATTWAAVAATLAYGGLTVAARRRTNAAGGAAAREPLAWRLAALVPALAAALLVAYTGHLGGIMVWGVPAG